MEALETKAPLPVREPKREPSRSRSRSQESPVWQGDEPSGDEDVGDQSPHTPVEPAQAVPKPPPPRKVVKVPVVPVPPSLVEHAEKQAKWELDKRAAFSSGKLVPPPPPVQRQSRYSYRVEPEEVTRKANLLPRPPDHAPPRREAADTERGDDESTESAFEGEEEEVHEYDEPVETLPAASKRHKSRSGSSAANTRPQQDFRRGSKGKGGKHGYGKGSKRKGSKGSGGQRPRKSKAS